MWYRLFRKFILHINSIAVVILIPSIIVHAFQGNVFIVLGLLLLLVSNLLLAMKRYRRKV
jgi:hypothetical protein